MYAIIEEGGRQFKVTAGDILNIDRQLGGEDKSVTFDRVLMVGGDDSPARVGAPLVGGVTVTADVLGPVKGDKIVMQKYRRRKGYSKKQGHRQKYTQVKVTAING